MKVPLLDLRGQHQALRSQLDRDDADDMLITRDTMKRSFRAEREFGLIVGGILVLLSGWWLYRGKFINAADIMLPTGALLILFGLLLPRALVYPNKAWMLFAEGISFVTTPIILGVVFFLVITPIGVIKRLLGWDPLGRRGGRGASYWKPYSERQRDTRHYEKMY